MADEMMTLRGLLEKSPNADVLRKMIGFAAQRVMELEVGDLTGAGFGEKSPEFGAAQRLSRQGLGDPRRHGRTAHPQAEEGQLLPGLPRAAPQGEKGADGCDPGGLHPGHLDPLGRRPYQGDRDERHLKEPGVAARVAFALDCCAREAIGHVATTEGIKGEDVCDLMVTAVEHRSGKLIEYERLHHELT